MQGSFLVVKMDRKIANSYEHYINGNLKVSIYVMLFLCMVI